MLIQLGEEDYNFEKLIRVKPPAVSLLRYRSNIYFNAYMRIAFITRSTLFSVPGGDTIQIEQTARFLQQYGVQADLIPADTGINYSQYDLLHFFNITRPADILYHALKTKIPYVVTPLLIDYSEYDRLHRKGFSGAVLKIVPPSANEYIKTVGRWILAKDKLVSKSYLYKGQDKSSKEIVKRAEHILPNSALEMAALEKKYSLQKPYTVVPNGIDGNYFQQDRAISRNSKLVICAARIEGIKNQLNLIKALNNSEFQVLLIGAAAPNQQGYYTACRQAAEKNIEFMGPVPQAALAAYYQKAGVHVLPSWFETCGLSSLEAAATGCPIVITGKGYTRDYFGDDAFYCEPGDTDSILTAVRRASACENNDRLSTKISTDYTWKKTAAVTSGVYHKILSR